MKERRFKHLSWTDRLKIEKMSKEGYKPLEIAAAIRVHHSTIYRELRRGRQVQRTTELIDREVYCADEAERKYRDNLAAKGPDLKIGNDRELADYIEKKIIEDKYSPAAVLGKIKELGLQFSVTISEWTLYSYISKGVFLRLTNKNLPMRGRRKKSYRKVRAARPPKGDSIEQRPEHINSRAGFGDWEMDTVEGKKGTRPRILVLTERLTRQEIAVKIPDGTAASVVSVLDKLERKMGAESFTGIFRSITVDNGSEFADCTGIQNSCLRNQPRTHVYYCHPYSSYERGSNENVNKLIRRWYPKGTNFTRVPASAIRAVQLWINDYPREIHSFKCSNTLFQKHVEALGFEHLHVLS
jgi:Transposase and inactivated derivatives, IS30 family